MINKKWKPMLSLAAASIKESPELEYSSRKMDMHLDKKLKCIVLLTINKEKHLFKESLWL